jgi:hypothetical protein
MKEICEKEGGNYKYLLDDTTITENIDKNTDNDKEFNRNYNDIPEKDMCPINFKFACSDDINWRNKCSENPANNDGKCEGGETITSEGNKPMRNFNCHGFKCYNGTYTTNEGKWSPNEDYCKVPTDRFAKKNITQFLFNINAFKCEVKEGTTDIRELSFCHSHPQLERKEVKNIPFFDKIVIVNKDEKYDIDGAIKLEDINDLKLNETNLYDLYAIKSNIKEGITEFKIVGPEENCNGIPENNTFPGNWKEAKNESKIIGCYGRNNIFDFEKESIDESKTQANLSSCKSSVKKNYYGFQPLDGNGDCLESNTIPFLPKYQNFNDCASSDEQINGLCDGNICGFTADNINKIAIYKKTTDGEKSNIMNNRVYHNFRYKIFNKSAGYMYKWDKGFLNTIATTNDNISEKIGDTDSDTFIKIVRVSGIDNQTPICYNEPIHLRFTINGEEKTLKANPIKGHDRINIINGDKYLNANTDNKQSNSHTLRSKGAVESYKMTFPEGYNIKETNVPTNKGSFYFFSTNKEGTLGDETNDRDHRRAISVESYDPNVKSYHGNCLKIKDTADTADGVKEIEIVCDINEDNEANEEESMKNLEFQGGQISQVYFAGFHKLIDKDEEIKEGKEYYIYSTLTEYMSYTGKGKKGNTYKRQVRGILNKELTLAGHFNTSYKIKLISDSTRVQKEIFPSSINKYKISGTTKKISFVKTENNFCFTTNSDLEELEFKIVKTIGSEVQGNTFDQQNYIDIGKENRIKLYLYNEKYNFYLTINKKDTNKNSVIYNDVINKENVKDENCQLNMVMAKIDYNIPQELKKVCYKTSPFQSVDLKNMTMDKQCTEIKMNENILNFPHGQYNFCTKQEASTQDLTNNFVPPTLKDSNGFKPYPIP